MSPLIVLPSLEDVPAGPELRAMVEQLPRERFSPRVAVLDRADGPNAEAFRLRGLPVLDLNASHWVDLRAWKKLRNELITHRPSLIHVYGTYALRLASLARLRTKISPQILFTDIGDAERSSWFTRRVIPPRETHLARGEQGIPFGPLPSTGFFDLSQIQGRPIAVDGVFDTREEWVVALRSFDFLKLIYPDVGLLLSGPGPMIPKLQTFGTQIGANDVRFQFVGRCADLPSFFERSLAVWVPSVQPGAAQRTLTAMAVGRPVIAVRCPETEAIIRHDETGWLFESGDYVMLAKYTRRLLDHPEMIERMGEAGRRIVAEQFPISRVVEGFASRYDHCD